MLQVALLVGLLAVLLYVALRATDRPAGEPAPAAVGPGRWRTAHYDLDGETRVVLQKVADGSGTVIDEHLIATVSSGDPEYDERFMTAMSTARQRLALFESEDGG